MLHVTWRRISLLPDSFSNPSPLRRFIHNSRCVSGVFVTQFSGGEQPTALRNADAEQRPTISSEPLASDIFAPYNKTLSRVASSKPSSSDRKTKSAKTTQVHTANESVIPKTKPKPRFVNPPPPKIEAFLRQLEFEGDTLTLIDVENCRPSKITDTRSSEYEVHYNAAVDRLMRSFDIPSMRRIFDLYSIPQLPVSLQRKKLYAEAILEYWGWKPTSVVKEDILDETLSSELCFPLSNDEAFLLMGKDGAELLNLAQRYGVNLSFHTGDALSLKATGLQGSLKRLTGYLNSFKTDIQVERTSLHLGQTLPFETLKKVSRLSGAYLMADDDRLRISFHRSQPRSHEVAKRLAVQAVSKLKINIDAARPVVLTPGSSTSPYSLYPFTPQQELSWEISSLSSSRLRRIAHWLDSGHPTNPSLNGGLYGSFGSSELLRNDLTSRLSPSTNSASSLEIFACTGHFLFLSPSQEQTLLPPMIGQQSADDIIQWAQKSPELVTFNHSIPISMFTYSVDKKQHLRRLVYVEQSNPAKTLRIEIAHTPENAERETEYSTTGPGTRCYTCEKISSNILLPDRPIDMQISAARVQDISVPDELFSFVAANEPASQPSPNAPLQFTLDSIKYALASDKQTCREFKTVYVDNKSINVVTETSTDMDIDQHQTACKVICENYSSSESWHEFLDNCDKISTLN